MPVSHLFHSAFEHSDVHQAVPWIVRVEETLDLSSCFFLLTPGLAESSANIITIVDAAAVGLPQKALEDVCTGPLSVSAHVQSFRWLQMNDGQLQTPQLMFPSQIDSLHSIPSCSALSLTEEDWGGIMMRWMFVRLPLERFSKWGGGSGIFWGKGGLCKDSCSIQGAL